MNTVDEPIPSEEAVKRGGYFFQIESADWWEIKGTESESDQFLKLCTFCYFNLINRVKRLVEVFPNYKQSRRFNPSPLLDAIDQGHMELVKWLIEENPNYWEMQWNIINRPTCVKMLYNAVSNGHLDLAKWIYENKPPHVFLDISQNNEEIFNVACCIGRLDIVKWLYEIKPDICISVASDEIFCNVCYRGNLEVAKWILETKPDLYCSGRQELPFRNACSEGHLELAQWLIKVRPDIDIRAKNDNAFLFACKNGHTEVAQWLYQVRPDISIRGITIDIIVTTIRYGHLDLAMWLYDLDPNVNLSSGNEFLFVESCQNGYLDIVKWLLTVKPDIDIFIDSNRAFTCAFENDHTELTLWLFEVYKERIEENSELGEADNLNPVFSVYYDACFNGNIPQIQRIFKISPTLAEGEFLLRGFEVCCFACPSLETIQWFYNLNPEYILSNGIQQAFTEACDGGHLNVIQWLIEIKPDLDIGFQENVAFLSACQSGHCEVAQWLFEQNPDIDIRSDGDSVFRFVCENDYILVAKWLCELIPNYGMDVDDTIETIDDYWIMPTIPYLDAVIEKKTEANDCSICYERSDAKTSCGHYGCVSCFKRIDRNLCPYCKQEITYYLNITYE
jgi:ankyrin repeat protein